MPPPPPSLPRLIETLLTDEAMHEIKKLKVHMWNNLKLWDQSQTNIQKPFDATLQVDPSEITLELVYFVMALKSDAIGFEFFKDDLSDTLELCHVKNVQTTKLSQWLLQILSSR